MCGQASALIALSASNNYGDSDLLLASVRDSDKVHAFDEETTHQVQEVCSLQSGAGKARQGCAGGFALSILGRLRAICICLAAQQVPARV